MPSESTPSDINKVLQILRRDQFDATYKFALLRGMIEVIEQAPFRMAGIDPKEGIYPLGLLVERWVYFYFPLVQAGIPQKHGELPGGEGQTIAFRPQFEKAVAHYSEEQGYSEFHHDYQRGRITGRAAADFQAAASKIAATITNMPMKHLGYSANERHYSVVVPEKKSFRRLACDCFDEAFLRASYGTYKISPEYLGPLVQLGSIIIGTDSILYQWAEFTAGIKGSNIDTADVLKIITTRPSDERDVTEARKAFLAVLERGEELPCVWCGKPIAKKDLAVDHVIPFSLWGDNSLTNLMPCHESENSRKSDKIPSPETLECSKDRILHYLRILPKTSAVMDEYDQTGAIHLDGELPNYGINREEAWFKALKTKCRSLIVERGYKNWGG